jgi:hypothetical protein
MEVSLQVRLRPASMGHVVMGVVVAGFAVGAVLGCSSQPPPPPPPPEVEKEPEPPPPPPPKCEAIKDQCKAEADTRARIPGTHYQLTPPAGWFYAQLEEATVAQVGDEGPVLVITTFEPGKVAKERVALVKSFAELVLIEPPKRLRFHKRDTPGRDDYAVTEIAGLEMTLWDRPGAARGKDKGPLLVLSSKVGDRDLFGLGFAPKGDDEGTKAILDALQTLAEGEPPEDEEEAGDGAKDEGSKP